MDEIIDKMESAQCALSECMLAMPLLLGNLSGETIVSSQADEQGAAVGLLRRMHAYLAALYVIVRQLEQVQGAVDEVVELCFALRYPDNERSGKERNTMRTKENETC